MVNTQRILRLSLLFSLLVLVPRCAHAGNTRLAVSGSQILLNGQPVKIIGLRCSNALISDATTDDLIAALDRFQSCGVNTVSVFLMGSRFGDVKGYLPDGSLNPVYRERLERILQATDQRGMIAIVGCLYWSTSKAKADLAAWTQDDADRAVGNTARWLVDEGFTNVILDPDNEGMAVRDKDWKVESLIRAAKSANPGLSVANNTSQNPRNEDLNMHFGNKEAGKPWFDSEATPGQTPGGYWGRYSKQTHQANSEFYNYSRIGRYTAEMQGDQLKKTRDQLNRFSGYVFAGTWLQCGPAQRVGGPFTKPGGQSNLGSGDDEQAPWNTDIDAIHPDAGILWWLEFIKETYGPKTVPGRSDAAVSASFVPYFFDDFEAYNDGTSLSAGKPFGAAGRTKASSEKAHQGHRSARMAIHQGDKGGFGRWGGVIPVKPALPRGSEIWVRLFVFWPGDFEFSAAPWMKFIRLHNQTGDKKNGGYNDLYVDNADRNKSVLRTIKEGHNVWRTYDGPPLARDRWESYEVYLFIDNESVDAGGKGRCRVWRDGKLIFDRTDVPTVSTADGAIDYLYLFTYWNNEKPPMNHVFVDDIVIATGASPPPNSDASGNTCVGDWMPNH